jgi:alkanesulfonate monooxygenase SsuD/methylene tetrahydromethanopterin reductase-like flavin-dependent oxidoreductase (luciferase family)
MELGLYTFGDLTANPRTGRPPGPQERMILAGEAGLDIVGVGEHHGVGFVNSATAVTIAAMAQATKQIRLTSAVTLLSTADPVRTFQEFATADLVSEGRVELIFGRGAFTESFPLFGFDLKDYDALFAEKLGLFAEINTKGRVTWSGRFRPALHEAEIAPRPAQGRLPVWIGAGSTASIERAARLGYPLAIRSSAALFSAMLNSPSTTATSDCRQAIPSNRAALRFSRIFM